MILGLCMVKVSFNVPNTYSLRTTQLRFSHMLVPPLPLVPLWFRMLQSLFVSPWVRCLLWRILRSLLFHPPQCHVQFPSLLPLVGCTSSALQLIVIPFLALLLEYLFWILHVRHSNLQISHLFPCLFPLLGTISPLVDATICPLDIPSIKPLPSQRVFSTKELDSLNVNPTLSISDRDMLRSFLTQNRDLKAFSTAELGLSTLSPHHINTQGLPPVAIPPRRSSPACRSIINSEVSEMLKQGIIQDSSSPYSSPVVIVKKKDGAYHFCIDYRQLNSQTKVDNYPLPALTMHLIPSKVLNILQPWI